MCTQQAGYCDLTCYKAVPYLLERENTNLKQSKTYTLHCWITMVSFSILTSLVGSFVVFNSSEKLSGCLFHVGDVLIFRTNIFVDDIRIESFRAISFIVKIIWYFSACVCRFDFYFVLVKNRFYMFLKL